MTILGAADSGPSCYSRFVNEWFCWQYVEDRHVQITDALVEHIGITLAALVLGIVIAVPLALLARRIPRLESLVLGFSTGIYTIPSLALLPLLVPFTGLSARRCVMPVSTERVLQLSQILKGFAPREDLSLSDYLRGRRSA